jgi:GNAT superfamily N-acetyltransferase
MGSQPASHVADTNGLRLDLNAIEDIEAMAWHDMFAAAPDAFSVGAGLQHGHVAGMDCFAIRAAPTIQFNRAQGLAAALGSEGVFDAVQWLSGFCGEAWALQIPPDALTDEVATAIKIADLVGAGSWTKFVRSSEPLLTDYQIEIIVAEPETAADFGQAVQLGFEAPPPFARWAAELVGREGWTTVLAVEQGQILGAGSLFIHEKMGWLGMGCCLPAARNRGVQTALLASRIEMAHILGAELVVSETGTPQHGDEHFHGSYHNLWKLGFTEAYQRRCFRPAAQIASGPENG